MDIYKEAGLPDGVINLVPGYGPEVSEVLLTNEYLAGIYFTGSTKVFRQLWQQVGNNLDTYRNFPRLVGETGGKGFVIAHPSADRDRLVSALIRSGYEYQGQKCSACSRAYIPQSVWDEIKDKLVSEVAGLKFGQIEDFQLFPTIYIFHLIFLLLQLKVLFFFQFVWQLLLLLSCDSMLNLFFFYSL
jgi:1-pyrroline-5-carboxylate dehydrogenase